MKTEKTGKHQALDLHFGKFVKWRATVPFFVCDDQQNTHTKTSPNASVGVMVECEYQTSWKAIKLV